MSILILLSRIFAGVIGILVTVVSVLAFIQLSFAFGANFSFDLASKMATSIGVNAIFLAIGLKLMSFAFRSKQTVVKGAISPSV